MLDVQSFSFLFVLHIYLLFSIELNKKKKLFGIVSSQLKKKRKEKKRIMKVPT
ncbi:hypothetical protein SLEP1_g11120 [Rubroshorea leprosula]|uniref:Uncharacterized protein n=1 Tax=Rubroshorea leprosula TaxID=152421 RepID=A0AAV5IJJ6_9ROSI|nr:hypothetical protein SLEP1_g11120 [Rubroshorea leprosula]